MFRCIYFWGLLITKRGMYWTFFCCCIFFWTSGLSPPHATGCGLCPGKDTDGTLCRHRQRHRRWWGAAHRGGAEIEHLRAVHRFVLYAPRHADISFTPFFGTVQCPLFFHGECRYRPGPRLLHATFPFASLAVVEHCVPKCAKKRSFRWQKFFVSAQGMIVFVLC